jgi:hypothetical protein
MKTRILLTLVLLLSCAVGYLVWRVVDMPCCRKSTPKTAISAPGGSPNPCYAAVTPATGPTGTAGGDVTPATGPTGTAGGDVTPATGPTGTAGGDLSGTWTYPNPRASELHYKCPRRHKGQLVGPIIKSQTRMCPPSPWCADDCDQGSMLSGTCCSYYSCDCGKFSE